MNRISTSILAIFILAHPAWAEEIDTRWVLCPVPQESDNLQSDTNLADGVTRVDADEAFAEAESITRLRGNVVVQRSGATLLGDRAEYDKRNNLLHLEGHASYRNDGMRIDSARAKMDLKKESGSFDDAHFFFSDNHGSGRAERIEIADPQHANLYGLRYTTCPGAAPDWQLKASELLLDRNSNTGEAWHATLSFMGVPFFYSPYLNFPLEGRKSGILPPTFGTSDSNGTDFSLPIYWNIAPNQDATITPRNITARGGMVMGEYRYLGSQSRATLRGSFLGNDKIFRDDRSYISLDHSTKLGDGWNSALRYRETSDSDFFHDDLAFSDEATSQTHLERRADLTYNNTEWRFLARAQEYQTLSGTSPYKRLPQLRLDSRMPERRDQFNFNLSSESVRFAHDTRTPTGDRIDLKPTATLPLEGAAWFLTPKVAWRYTSYQLNDSTSGDHFERSLPIATLDGGLFFDREFQLGDSPYTQTLEPRLFYLNVPYEDQSDLPLFDTGVRDFSFGQLFSDNRFNGADRQADANQLATTLTTRFIDENSGSERFRAAIGQIHYFEDRRVGLTSSTPIETAGTSNYIGELSISPSDSLSLGVSEEWNPRDEREERLSTRLRYSPGEGKILALNYRYHRPDAIRQADMTLLWPLSPRWRLLASYRYDLENEGELESIGGLEYESCCWNLRLTAQERRDSVSEELDHSLYLTLELKGLATLGRGLEESLGRGILSD